MENLRTFRLMILAALITLAGFSASGSALGVQDKGKDKGASANKGKIEGTKWSSVEATVKGTKIAAGLLKLEFGKDGKLVRKFDMDNPDHQFTYGEVEELVKKLLVQ